MVLLKSCWHITCVRRHESLHKKTSQSRIIGYTYAGETQFLSYRRSTLAQSSKYSQKVVETDYISPLGSLPLTRILTEYQSDFWPQVISTNISFRSDLLSKPSLGIINIPGKKEVWRTQVHTVQHHKQAHLFGIILETFWLNLIGNTC